MTNHQITYKGKTYPTLSSLARELNVKYTALSTFALRHNYDLTNMAISQDGKLKMLDDKRYSAVVIDGALYPSMINAAKQLNVNYDIIREYVRYYGKEKQSKSFKYFYANYQKKHDKTINFHGMKFDNIKDMANFYGLSEQTMRRHIRKYGLNDKRAVMHFDRQTNKWYYPF